jgi:hypothetical protein
MRQLLASGQLNQSRFEQGFDEDDFWPPVKVFVPWGGATWLLTELDPDEPDIRMVFAIPVSGMPERAACASPR